MPTPPRLGRRIAVHGTVQGVGFRPFVYRLAVELGLEGTVGNADGHVVIDAAGTQDALGEFVRRVAQ
ncbi:MAG TPA: acylphosphatase, partial [Acidothermaceae bacterium]